MRSRLVLAAALLSCACSRMVDPKKLDPHIPPDAATFCGQALSLLVQRGAACLATTVDYQQLDLAYLPCEAWDHEIGLGHASYDRFAAADCIAAVGSAPCELLFGPNAGVPGVTRSNLSRAALQGRTGGRQLFSSAGLEVCRLVVSGSLNNGDGCTVDAACASGHCQVGTTCPGACGDFLLSGATGCSPLAKVGSQCQAGLVCHVAAGASTGTCLDIRYLNDDCTGLPEICEPGATCDPATNKCAPLRGAGVSCLNQLDCQPGLLCADTPAGLECTAPRAAGQACTVGALGCLWGTYCRSAAMAPGDAGTCTAWSGVGGGCNLGAAEPSGCLGGWCDMSLASPLCVDFVPETSACTASAQCGPGGICTPGIDVCFKACYP